MKKAIPVILIIAVIAIIANSCGGLGGNKDSNGRDETWARVVAEDIVSSHLKSPSSAKFSWPNETKVSLSDDVWTVRGWVDAQNGFGATIRSNYTVRFESSSTNKNAYSVKSCYID